MSAARGLPTALDAERMVLGSILMDPDLMVQASKLAPPDFSLESNRRIWGAIKALYELGVGINAMSVRMELDRRGHLESVGGFDALQKLDEGIPTIPNIESYIQAVKNASDLRTIIASAQHTMNRALSGAETPDEILSGVKESWLTISQNRQKSTLVGPGSIIDEGGGLTTYLDRRNRSEGVKTGLFRYDAMTGGMKPGKLYVTGARPSMGKTALVLNVIDHVSVKNDATSIIFSLEMDRQSLLDRMICSRARINTKKFEGGYLTNEEMQRAAKAAGEIDCDRILIDDKATTDMAEIHAKIRKEQARNPVGLVVIDYLQLMIGGKAEFRTGEASRISRDMKLVAKDCKVPVWALSQLSRDCDKRPDHRPQLSDLRETGAIEQDADLVSFLYREEFYHQDREDLRGRAELIVAKQRNGPIGTVNLVWLAEMVRFESMAEDYEHYTEARY